MRSEETRGLAESRVGCGAKGKRRKRKWLVLQVLTYQEKNVWKSDLPISMVSVDRAQQKSAKDVYKRQEADCWKTSMH